MRIYSTGMIRNQWRYCDERGWCGKARQRHKWLSLLLMGIVGFTLEHNISVLGSTVWVWWGKMYYFNFTSINETIIVQRSRSSPPSMVYTARQNTPIRNGSQVHKAMYTQEPPKADWKERSTPQFERKRLVIKVGNLPVHTKKLLVRRAKGNRTEGWPNVRLGRITPLA